MENIRGYIIYLPEFSNSVEWADYALNTGRKNLWPVELYKGINGHNATLNDYGLKIFKFKKALRYMKRPGTLGCFLSHYLLWRKCVEENNPIHIFEHDVEFIKPYKSIEFNSLIKYEGFKKTKPIQPGNWWEGARAYTIKPHAASKIIDWVHTNGAMPADWCLNDGIVDVHFDTNKMVTVKQRQFSFTKDL